jgi:hypothetical protein
MSRLDSFIRRVCAQRDILNHICNEVAAIDGPVFELGLGNGRTFNHLRENLPGRRIIAFDRKLAAHKSSIPPDQDLVLGEIRETAAAFIGANAALVHADIGTGYDDIDAKTLEWLPDLVAGLLQPNGLAVSGLPLVQPDLQAISLPDSVLPDRYFIYRRK